MRFLGVQLSHLSEVSKLRRDGAIELINPEEPTRATLNKLDHGDCHWE